MVRTIVARPLIAASILVFYSASATHAQHDEGDIESPDVLFVSVDDLNDWVTFLDPSSPIRTPNLERLARMGVLFTKAYCASPACNPSRTATLTGLRPTTSGVYGNRSDWRGALPRRKTIMQRFRDAGYSVKGAGKIFHHHLDGAFHDPDSFDQFHPMIEQLYPAEKLNRAPEYGSRNTDWGVWPADVSDSIDFHTASHCVKALEESPTQTPLFLACGIFKPHSPFFAPAEMHRAYQSIRPPPRKGDDWSDLPAGASKLLSNKRWFWNGMINLDRRAPGAYKAFVRSYAACVSHADEQIGRVLDALAARQGGNSAIIVLWSDHGFHLGEKNHIEKFALWEKSTHVPLIIVAPGVTDAGTRCDRPVDLTSLYPTLLELAGLDADSRCDGTSLVPLLKNPATQPKKPALMTYGRGNHAVRDDRWRLIHYADGTEELYDHANDPNEWENLANDPGYGPILDSLRQWMPASEAQPVPDLRK